GISLALIPHSAWLRALVVPSGIIPKRILLPASTEATSVTVPSPPQAITIVQPACFACSASCCAEQLSLLVCRFNCIKGESNSTTSVAASAHCPPPAAGLAISHTGFWPCSV